MSNTLALSSAFLWGFAAFFGGQAARRSNLFAVLVLDQALAALFALPFAFFLAESFIFRDFLIGGISGIFGSAGVAFFYLGLRSHMVAVAPITGVVGAILPVIWGLGVGDHLSVWQFIGVALGLISILLVSGSGWRGSDLKFGAIINGVLAGTGFGFGYIIISTTDPISAPWPVLGARLLPAIVVLLVAAKMPWPAIASSRARPFIAGASFTDVLAAVLFLEALNIGLLSISSVLSCLHPAVTVLLARFFLRERVSGGQAIGLAVAVTSISMITVG
ncbi:MAG: DMT family transporter [Acidimicrobiales bacterium]|nr:DMT family transporter [Acidimicrobiales bacterium]